LVQQIKTLKYEVKYLRCNPGGENKALDNFCAVEGRTLEKTAANMPQQNGVVERKFTVLIQRAHTQMGAANFDDDARYLLWAQSVNTVNDMENISSNTLNKKSPSKLLSGKKSRLYGKLVEFGRSHLGRSLWANGKRVVTSHNGRLHK
jgi:hypothetical protein